MNEEGEAAMTAYSAEELAQGWEFKNTSRQYGRVFEKTGYAPPSLR